MEILLLTVRKFARDRFQHYVLIMHIHKSKMRSSTQLLILSLVALIHISFWSQRHEISVLPNNKYIRLLTNTEH